jgi:hypothetical protein
MIITFALNVPITNKLFFICCLDFIGINCEINCLKFAQNKIYAFPGDLTKSKYIVGAINF